MDITCKQTTQLLDPQVPAYPISPDDLAYLVTWNAVDMYNIFIAGSIPTLTPFFTVFSRIHHLRLPPLQPPQRAPQRQRRHNPYIFRCTSGP
ncbi:hypothetical protein HO173_010998 [Letharia columbiana]|uniref:Uncharacterized protein n=1 Tax=Letharia columbiana TaxID=112416 RepID=A0A8H6L0G8_9LECA|nr:uncharacterized protein HO173_010998 [Letharia columbiana]KAF6230882.1 hypothetical protein HO173_010998 [Letharia columbiana]